RCCLKRAFLNHELPPGAVRSDTRFEYHAPGGKSTLWGDTLWGGHSLLQRDFIAFASLRATRSSGDGLPRGTLKTGHRWTPERVFRIFGVSHGFRRKSKRRNKTAPVMLLFNRRSLRRTARARSSRPATRRSSFSHGPKTRRPAPTQRRRRCLPRINQ